MFELTTISKKKIENYLNTHRSNIPSHLLTIFRKAQDGEIGELVTLARQVISGAHVPKNEKLGWRIYRELREINNSSDYPQYIDYNYALSKNENKEFTESLAVMNKLVTENYLPAIARLGTFFDYGVHGVKADPQRAIMYYKKAAGLGHVHAKSLLANRMLKQDAFFTKLGGLYHKVTFLFKTPLYVWMRMHGHNEKMYI